MEQGEYPGSPGAVEATQGALGASWFDPNLHDHHASYAPSLYLDILARRCLPSVLVHQDSRTFDTLVILITLSLVI